MYNAVYWPIQKIPHQLKALQNMPNYNCRGAKGKGTHNNSWNKNITETNMGRTRAAREGRKKEYVSDKRS
jgi:hypothetical protein